MNSEAFGDARIVESWVRNAAPWTTAVREGQIESRKQITNQAIVDAVLRRLPGSVLDIGCGEGWLVRELVARDIAVVGVDAVPQLIEEAVRAGGGDCRVMSYEDIAAGKLEVVVDVAVCNFALLGKESVEGIFKTVPSLLNRHGAFIVQTLHPAMVRSDLPNRDGWREGSWAGFSAEFSDPAPWYFRTAESWIKLFADNGLQLCEVLEPTHPSTGRPVSIVFVGAKAG